jgi:hypothetical protein
MGTAVVLISAYQYSSQSEVITEQGYQYFLFSFLFGVSYHIGIGNDPLWTKQKIKKRTGQFVDRTKFSE